MIVLDASAAVEMLLNTAAGKACSAATSAGGPAIAPGHFDAEVYNTLRRAFFEGRVDRSFLASLVDQLARLEAQRIPIAPLLRGVTPLVDVVGAHDVFYVLLAVERACPLLTCDLQLARAATRLGVEVIAIRP